MRSGSAPHTGHLCTSIKTRKCPTYRWLMDTNWLWITRPIIKKNKKQKSRSYESTLWSFIYFHCVSFKVNRERPVRHDEEKNYFLNENRQKRTCWNRQRRKLYIKRTTKLVFLSQKKIYKRRHDNAGMPTQTTMNL